MANSAADGEVAATHGVPNIGEIVRRLRQRSGESLRDVAQGTGLSASFLSMVERGECDITLSRLAAIANHFNHDVGSFLGYSVRGARPRILRHHHRVAVNRGEGIKYEVLQVPGAELELLLVEFAPHTEFANDLVHEGIDIILVLEGQLVITMDGIDYPLAAGEAAVSSGAYGHRIRNDGDQKAVLIGVVTELVY